MRRPHALKRRIAAHRRAKLRADLFAYLDATIDLAEDAGKLTAAWRSLALEALGALHGTRRVLEVSTAQAAPLHPRERIRAAIEHHARLSIPPTREAIVAHACEVYARCVHAQIDRMVQAERCRAVRREAA